jgi:hypothetical protein
MNERIKLLAEQANVLHTDFFDNEWEVEKFAELIVTDAIGVLQKRFMGDLNREDMEVRRCIEDLKKHFGVEE